MAPLNKPDKLQTLCITKFSEVIVSPALKINQTLCHPNFEILLNYINKTLPNRFKSEIFHKAINRVALMKLKVVRPESIMILMKMLLCPAMMKLSLSDLAYAGSTSYEILDLFEELIALNLPKSENLTVLDLSTHRVESSLPSCSYSLLESIGNNFSNLKVLDLNHNNRVTGEGLSCLAPSRFSRGCPLLEKIYVRDCSVTHDDILWLLFTFKRLKKVGYSAMGIILEMFVRACRRRRCPIPDLNLVHIDNTESASDTSDFNTIWRAKDLCPNITNLKIRVKDEDTKYLYELETVTKLELRFYTGSYHSIGDETIYFLRWGGSCLQSLTIYCGTLESYHVTAIAYTCNNLWKLFLHANQYEESDFSMMDTPNNISNLKELTIRIGKHEMDRTSDADTLVLYLMGSCYKLEKVHLLLCCLDINDEFLDLLFNKNHLSNLKLLICDAPRRNLDLPLIHFNMKSAERIIKTCAEIETLGNLISWSITKNQIEELRQFVIKQNYKVNIIHDVANKLNKKYF